MARCRNNRDLEVHHKRRDGGNGIENAEVLCHACHVNTSTYGMPGQSPTPFSQETKDKALHRAGNRCECTSKECTHH